ncbi:hypothetical protein [Micromonospora sp. NPDC126480]|uniref:hypothetical protein n=1 Tax=Micromonospora sp. NPDC126480 TaxID=3155312 RepID=UPI0033178C6F
MSDHRGTWAELTNRLNALGLKLKLHAEQAKDDELSDALSTLRHQIEEAFAATGRAVEDEAVRADVREVARLLGAAVSDSLTRLGDDVRETVRRRG